MKPTLDGSPFYFLILNYHTSVREGTFSIGITNFITTRHAGVSFELLTFATSEQASSSPTALPMVAERDYTKRASRTSLEDKAIKNGRIGILGEGHRFLF